jgi:hypothetical protein
MLQTNPEIDHIVAEATDLAKNLNHEYVTLEHVFLSMIRFDPFRDLLAQFGADVNSLDADLEAYLLQATNLIVSDLEPKKTHALERTFNRALTQVLFSSRTQLEVVDLFLSIHAETNSYAHYFMVKYGLDRTKLVDIYNKNYKSDARKSVATAGRADKVLDHYCDNLNAQAVEGKIDPVIGRHQELNDIVEILNDKQFKWIGRYDNVINSGGIKLFPEQIEAKLASKITKRFFITDLHDDVLGSKLVLVLEGESVEIDITIFDALDKFEKPKEVLFVPKFVETETKKVNRIITLKNIK